MRGPLINFNGWLWFWLNTGKYPPQYNWLQQEFPKVNRSETPWLIVLLHSPWYNSNNYHYMEGESMRVIFEPWFVENKVDIVFAGHVHAYERSVSFLPQTLNHSVLILLQGSLILVCDTRI